MQGNEPPISEPSERPEVGLIGAGAAATVLGRALVSAGYVVSAVVSRRAEAAERLARRLEAPVASDVLLDLPQSVRFLVLAVPDAAISDVASEISVIRESFAGLIATHLSGSLSSALLEPLRERGARVMSFHPAQTLIETSEPSVLRGAGIAIEGDDEAIPLGFRIASEIGARPFRLDADTKALYHLSLSVASNFLVTLAGIAGEALTRAGLSDRDAAALLGPLLGATVSNLEHTHPRDALTGPIVRGDAGTVRLHLEALRTHLPDLLPVYRELGRRTLVLARASGRLSEDDGLRIAEILL